MGEVGADPQLSSEQAPAPNGSDSLGSNAPKVVPKVTGSWGGDVCAPCPSGPITSLFYTAGAQEPRTGTGAEREGTSREEGRVHGQQWLYGWPWECEVKGTPRTSPEAPLWLPGATRVCSTNLY